MSKLNPIPMPGMEGHNLLGFLAALGVFYELDQVVSGEVRLSWARQRSTWSPVIWSECGTRDELVSVLVKRLCGTPRPVPAVAEQFADINFEPNVFRELLQNHEEDLALLAALATEIPNRKGKVQDTFLRTISGPGHQHFLGFARYLIENVIPDRLPCALFEKWKYEDDKKSFRWDSADYRPHALRGEDPSGDDIRSVWWANRLAFSALPLFPCYPSPKGLRTAGFQIDDRRNVTLTWPIWKQLLTVDVVRCLIPLASVESGKPLSERGIEAIYQSTRFEPINEFGRRNFTIGRVVG